MGKEEGGNLGELTTLRAAVRDFHLESRETICCTPPRVELKQITPGLSNSTPTDLEEHAVSM